MGAQKEDTVKRQWIMGLVGFVGILGGILYGWYEFPKPLQRAILTGSVVMGVGIGFALRRLRDRRTSV